MKKVAIVGVEGSGKTVMLAGLGSLYERPDDEGYYLEPLDRKTYFYVSGLVNGMRNGHWPAATETDAQKQLCWNLRKRDGESAGEVICRVSFFDFAGEVYRDAFGREKGVEQKFRDEGNCLRRNVRQADVVFVLVNLSDIIHGAAGSDRSTEIGWTTKSILDYIYKPDRTTCPKTVIVLSQADAYKATIDAEGGPEHTLEKFLPVVGNSYADVEMIAVAAVDKIALDDEGVPIPDANFSFVGLKVLMDVILREMNCLFESNDDALPDTETRPAVEKYRQSYGGFCSMIAGSAIVSAVLVFLSLCHSIVTVGGMSLTLVIWIALLGGLMLFCHGAKGMASASMPGLLCTLALIGILGAIGAQYIYTSDFLKGVALFLTVTMGCLR